MTYRLHHDFETFSKIDIRKMGGDVYSRDSSTEVLMCAYAFDDAKPDIWVPAEGQPMPKDLIDAVRDPECVKFAWNKPFEYGIWKNNLGETIPHHRWRDPMVLAMSCSFPGSLDKVGPIVGIDADKQKLSRGKALIRKFCVPRKPTKALSHVRATHLTDPVEWEEFKGYCLNDVEAERAIWHKLKKHDMPTHEWNYWVLDQIINQAGIPINTDMVDGAVRIYEEALKTYMDEMRIETGLANPNSNVQILPWLQERGYPFDDLKKGHVVRAIERCDIETSDITGISGEDMDDNVKKWLSKRSVVLDPNAQAVAQIQQLKNVMDLRVKSSAASVKKFYALQRATDYPSGLLRNCFQFAGAQRTWRWAGRTFQPQNLPRPDGYYSMRKTETIWDYSSRLAFYSEELIDLPAEDIQLLYGDPISMLKSMVRPAAQAPDGYVFVDADLNAIENRVLGWMASDQKILDVFKHNRDPYVDFATYMYNRPYDELYAEYKAGDKSKRTVAKPGVLGCGYMLGAGEERVNQKTGEVEAGGLLGYAWNMGVKLTAEESKMSVTVFRDTFKAVKKFWYELERAALECVTKGHPTTCRMLRFDLKGEFLRMQLPSGRYLHYFRPKVEPKRTPWGEMRDNLTYMGLNAQGQWVRISTHPGKLTENADQAISRDLLAHGMRLAFKEGIDIRMHIHDQIVGLSKEDRAEAELKILIDCMSETPEWAPGLPLGTAGHICKVFLKD